MWATLPIQQIKLHSFAVFTLCVLLALLQAACESDPNDIPAQSASDSADVAILTPLPTEPPKRSESDVPSSEGYPVANNFIEPVSNNPVEDAYPVPPTPIALRSNSYPVEVESVTGYPVNSAEPFAAGLACFSTPEFGTVCLSAEGKWITYTEDNSGIGKDYVIGVEACGDSMIFIHLGMFSVFDGENWERFTHEDWERSFLHAVVCTPDGGYWVAFDEGVAQFKEGIWTTFDIAQILLDGKTPRFMEVTSDGTLWVAGWEAIARYDGTEWHRYYGSDEFPVDALLTWIALDSAERMHLSDSGDHLYFDGTTWQIAPKNGSRGGSAVAFDANDNRWISVFGEGIFFYGVDQTTVKYDKSNSGLLSEQITLLEIDAAGRVWAISRFGVSVWDGQSWRTYTMSNSGLDSELIHDAAVLGNGPLLPSPQEKAFGGIIGRIWYEGEPVGNQPVHICPDFIYRDRDSSMCEDSARVYKTTTDAQGDFAFNDVAVGRYRFTAQIADEWRLLYPSDDLVIANAVNDVENLEVSSK